MLFQTIITLKKELSMIFQKTPEFKIQVFNFDLEGNLNIENMII